MDERAFRALVERIRGLLVLRTGFTLIPIELESRDDALKLQTSLDQVRYFEAGGAYWREVLSELLSSFHGVTLLWAREWDSEHAIATLEAMNRSRDRFTKSPRNVLALCGPVNFLRTCADHMPDLWSIRDISFLTDRGDEPEAGHASWIWPRYWLPHESAARSLPPMSRDDPDAPGLLMEAPSLPRTEDLQETPCAVLLGPPGSGKTHEISRWRRRSRQRGKRTFYHDLTDIVGLETWAERVGAEEDENVEIFLDSLDIGFMLSRETIARLGSLVRRWLESKHRLRLACRSSQWSNYLEEQIRREMDSVRGPSPDAWVFRLMPVQRAQIERYFQASKVQNAREILQDLLRRGASPLLAFPLDLEVMIQAFEQGADPNSSIVELYDQCGLSRARERSTARLEMSLRPSTPATELHRAAARLAAVVLACEPKAVALESEPGTQGLLELGSLGPLLPADLIRKVLDSALVEFDAPRLDFHHQRLAENLASKALDEALRDGASLGRVRALFFGPDDDIALPALEEPCGWLAARNQEFRAIVLDRQPELLLRVEVETLPLEQRRVLVRSVLRRQGEGWSTFDPGGFFQGFARAASGCEELLLECAFSPRESTPSRRLALRALVELRCEQATDAALKLALEKSEAENLRAWAVRLVGRLGTAAQKRALLPLARGSDRHDPDHEVKGCALEFLWPSHIPPEERFELLQAPPDPGFFGAYWAFLTSIMPSRVTEQDLPRALRWLRTLSNPEGMWTLALGDPRRRLMERAWPRILEPEMLSAFKSLLRASVEDDSRIPVPVLSSPEEDGP